MRIAVPDKFRQFLGWLSDEFDDARLEANEFIDAGDALRDDGTVVNLVVVSMATRGRGKASGVETSWDFGTCGRFGMARL